MKKCVVITGCSSGIGYTAAVYLNNKNFRVIATCRKKDDCERLISQGIECVELDLDYPESVKLAAEKILLLCNEQLYALVNNAGFGVYGSLDSVSREQLERQFSTNFFGVHQLTQLLLPAIISANSGRIIQISSVMGLISTANRGAYAASKYALEAWSDALRLELTSKGVQISLIEPGPVSTSFSNNTEQVDQDKRVKNPPIARRFTLTPDVIMPSIFHALTAQRAKIRYKLSLMTKVVSLMKRLFPDRLMDRVLRDK